MIKKRRKRKALTKYAEEFAISLLYEASSGSLGRSRVSKDGAEPTVPFKERRALLDSITKLISAQDAPEEEEDDGIAAFKERLSGGNSREIERGADNSEDEADGVRGDAGGERSAEDL